MLQLCKNFSVKKARYIQTCLSKKVIHTDRLPIKIKIIAGVDISYVGDIGIAAVTVYDYNSLKLLETQITTCKVQIAYIPTLLAFREIAPALTGIRRLNLQPEIFLVDAQGWAHPYRCGFASHLGVILGKPTIGVAKRRLIGNIIEKKEKTILVDKEEIIGEVVRTKAGSKPIYVSIGHMLSLETAVSIVKHCSKNGSPEPLIQAHKLATAYRKKLEKEIE